MQYIFDLNITANTSDYDNILRNVSIPFDELFISCSNSLDKLDCSNMFTEVITDYGVCYTYNMLDTAEIYRDNIINSNGNQNHDRKSSWSLQDGYKSNGLKTLFI